MMIASVRRTAVLLAAAGCLLVLLPAQAQTSPEDEMRQVIDELDSALISNDQAAFRRLVAPKFVWVHGQSCDGTPAEAPGDRAKLVEMPQILADNGVSYERERRSFDVQILGNGPIGVVRTRVWESLSWPTGSMGGETDEIWYLNRINGRYQVIILEGHEVCGSSFSTGDAPE